MTKFKLGAMIGFGVGWAVGSGRAAELWDQLQKSMTRNESGSALPSEANGYGGSGTMASEAAHRDVASA
jgi:hypothetical protein